MGCGCGGAKFSTPRLSSMAPRAMTSVPVRQQSTANAMVRPATAPAYIVQSQALAQRRQLTRRQV